MKNLVLAFMLVVAKVNGVHAQTRIDLRTQSKGADFSAAASTEPMKVGSTLPGSCVVGELFYDVNVPAGANIYGCTAVNTWTPQGSGGSGPSTASNLLDFAVIRTSASNLSIGSNCSPSTPCIVRFGSSVYSFLNGGAVTITGGTGQAFGYVASSGVLTVGSNLTTSCTAGCVSASGVTSFPLDSIPLFTWNATSGSWDLTGVDQRAFLSSNSIVPGSGLIGVQASGQTVFSLDPSIVGQRTAIPASSSSACVSGNWAADSAFYYVCASQNSWYRVAVSTF